MKKLDLIYINVKAVKFNCKGRYVMIQKKIEKFMIKETDFLAENILNYTLETYGDMISRLEELAPKETLTDFEMQSWMRAVFTLYFLKAVPAEHVNVEFIRKEAWEMN